MTKDLTYYMSLNYEIRLKKYTDESWGAIHPELPGTVGGGDTIQEALEMLEEAKELWLEHYLDEKRAIPEPKPDLLTVAKS
jgi:antitoxin HicB